MRHHRGRAIYTCPKCDNLAVDVRLDEHGNQYKFCSKCQFSTQPPEYVQAYVRCNRCTAMAKHTTTSIDPFTLQAREEHLCDYCNSRPQILIPVVDGCVLSVDIVS